MKIKTLFFTRTNTCQRVAAKIADKLGCEKIQITDHKNWGGFGGWLLAGFYSSTNRTVSAEILGDLDGVDQVVLVTPLWAGGIAPAARAAIKQIGREKIHLVVVSDGSTATDRAGYLSVHDIVKKERNEDVVIEKLVAALKARKK